MTPYSIQADAVAKEGAQAGEKLWLAIEAARNYVSYTRLVDMFSATLETLTEHLDNEEERELFHASAMLAIRLMVGGNERAAIEREAQAAYDVAVRFYRDLDVGAAA